jgi:type II secretory pathway pseudopilin PulG
VELVLALAVVGLLTLMTIPRVGRIIQRARVNRATATVASDLEAAFSMAARQRRPIRISCNCAAQTYTLADRNGGTVRLRRSLSGDVDFGVTSLSFSASPVDVFPSGVASAPDTIRIGAGGWTRVITMTTAGQVRILP